MRKATPSREGSFFLSAALISLLACVATAALRNHLTLHNDRVRYGVDHLPAAFLAIAIFTALFALFGAAVARGQNLESRHSSQYCAALTAIFGVFWLPAWLSGGFVMDDWQLLAAASVRKIIYLHPGYSWVTLDSVDGNFRPLGTVLYFGYMLRAFGMRAHAFTLGPLLLVLLASLVAFAIVRELGYFRITAAAAALLFLSRGMVYTIVTWASALGDGIAILFCGTTAWLVLKANKRRGAGAITLHLLAWVCFVIATLGKQSAFVTPLIVALLLLMRPGAPTPILPLRSRRLISALTGLAVYGASAAFVFLHAKLLLRAQSPYPIGFSLRALFQSFSFATWYVFVLQFPDKFRAANLLPGILGVAIVLGVLLIMRKYPTVLGDRPRDVVFALFAAAASVSLFVVLSTRSAPYYGCMSAFWISIALGIALTRFGTLNAENFPARLCAFIFCLLVVSGFAEIRLEQTGLFPSGGYIWGTYGMETERKLQVAMARDLDAARSYDSLVLIDCPYTNPYTSMALLDAPEIRRILLYDERNNVYTANDRAGLRPGDDVPGLTDAGAYHWTMPMSTETATNLLAGGTALRMRCLGSSSP